MSHAHLIYAISMSKQCIFTVCRVEDTDQARSTKESEDAVLRDLAWLGITYDEGKHAPLLLIKKQPDKGNM